MKTYKYIALAALALGFTACSQDDDFTPQQEDVVQIASVNIATEVQTRVNTLGDGEQWENNDQILLVNNSRDSKNSGTYTATVTTGENPTTTWKLTNGTVLYASGTNTTNDFTAYYPASVDFTLPTDQSTEAGIKSADRMVATTTGVAKNAAVALSFERRNAKITITPTLTTEFTGKSISSLLIAGVTPYHPEEATDYTAIITPSETGFTVFVTVDGQSLTAESSTKIEAGKHYTFSLTVGKNLVDITNVSVVPWGTGADLEDGVANEYLPSIDGTEYASLTDLQNAVKDKLSQEGATSVTIGGYLSDGMHAAIISAINEVKTEGVVMNGPLLAGSVTYTVHTAFAGAISEWTDGTTLTLLGNTPEYPDHIRIEDKTVVLDLNGYKLLLNTSENKWIVVQETSRLTIRDTRGGGEYNIYSSSFVVYGTLNIEGGTIDKYVAVQTSGIVNMTGGTLLGNRSDGPYKGVLNRGTFNMLGGTISSIYAVEGKTGSVVNIFGNAVLNVTENLFDNDEGTTAIITGGTFSHNPSAYVDTEKYTVTQTSDSKWVVAEKE